MPYVEEERRKALASDSTVDYDSSMKSKGELNYNITQLFIEYLEKHGLSYTNITNASGAARDAANELDRRILHPYENKMKKKNGDVFQSLLKLLKKV